MHYPEFSYRTNPSTWGSEGESNTDSQSVQTTLYILAHPRDDDSIFIDVYPMPRPEILSPVAGDTGTEGTPIQISWDERFLETGQDAINVLDDVQVWFSPFSGLPNSYQLVETVGFTTGSSYDWVPTGESVTSQGKIKLIFTNVVNERTSETILDGTISISGTQIPWEHLISPNGGESFFVGVPYDISWTNFQGTLQSVDIQLSVDGGISWETIVPDADFQVVGDANVYTWVPEGDFLGEHTRIKVISHFPGGHTFEDASDGDFSFYPLGATYFDVSVDSDVNYSGTPYSAVSLEYTNDDNPDMFVTIQDCEGCSPDESKSRLYKNEKTFQYPIKFEDRTPHDFSEGSYTRPESRGLSVGDFNNDNAPDIFVTHKDFPQLFKFENDLFTDVVNETSVFKRQDLDLLKNSSCVTWVDFDHDGDLDFYLGRGLVLGADDSLPLFNTLFENRGSSLPFLEVGRTLGLVDETKPGISLTVAWSDFDNDNLWEVAIGGLSEDIFSPGSPTQLYSQNSDQTFCLEESPFPPSVKKDLVNSLEWVDFDQDSDLDLLLVRSASDSYIALNDQGQLTDVITLSGASDWASSSGISCDLNLDGFPDVLLGNKFDTFSPRMLENLLGYDVYSQKAMVDLAPGVSLAGNQASIQGLLASDFDGDGDLDLFLGRSPTTGRIFRNQQLDGVDAPANNWISVKLSSQDGVNNTMGIGAMVSVHVGSLVQTKQVDGGSGRGGQAGQNLVFGLGTASHVDSLIINWPNGFRQKETPGSNLGHHTILDQTTLSITTGSTLASYEVIDVGVNFEFAWETNVATSFGNDEVKIFASTSTADPQCIASDIYLSPSSSDVEHLISKKTDGTYRHVFKWNNQPCTVDCLVKYSVKSMAGSSLVIETQRAITTGVCGNYQQLSQ